MTTLILRRPSRTVHDDGTVTVEPGLIETAGPHRMPTEADGWLNGAQASRRLGVPSRAVYDAVWAGVLAPYATAGGGRRWFRLEEVDALRCRTAAFDQSLGGGRSRRMLTVELYLPDGGA